MAVLALLITGCVSGSVPPLPDPPQVEVAPTSTSVPDRSGTSLPPVGGTTTTAGVELRPGTATLRGRVLAGGAPVGRANVRVERLVDERVATSDVVADGEGNWSVTGVLGGRYRLRAYRPPDAAMTTAEVIFVGAAETRTVDLDVQRFSGGTNMFAAIAPDPPLLGELANVVIAVNTLGVDSSGVARSIPSAAVSVVLVSEGGRPVVSPNPALTNGNGRAQFQLSCVALEAQGLTVVLPDGSQYPAILAPCRIPPPTTTTLPPPALTDIPPSA